MNSRLLITAVAAGIILTGCEATRNSGNPAETDAFLRNALDTYGVIDVVPSAPVATNGSATAPAGEPLDATNQRARPQLTVAEACEGKTGVQRGLRDTRTGEWLDCGPGEVAPTS